jgi:NAD+ kinase
MHIGLIPNMSKPLAGATLDALSSAAVPLGIRFVLPSDSPDEAFAHLPGARKDAVSRFGEGLDAVLSLGGDGTVLRAIRALHGRATPILGINLGHLGFLTAVPAEDATHALSFLAAGQFALRDAPLLEARLAPDGRDNRVPPGPPGPESRNSGTPESRPPKNLLSGSVSSPFLALNDVVLGWGATPRSAMIDLAVDSESVASYVADGFIVATPLGSTGHALSAGGPILHPDAAAPVLAPICPHTLSTRPLVLPDTANIELTLPPACKELLLSVDGQSVGWMRPGDRLTVRRAARSARFIHLPSYSWPRLLAQKLHWRGSSAEPK